MEERIKLNAELVIRQMRELCGFEFGYDARSVEWLDGFIERQRESGELTPETTQKLVSVLGSYLGQCIINCYGGAWEMADGSWRVGFDAKNAAYPFAKVHKRFENGAEDSIKGFFDAIPLLFAPIAATQEPEKKPWWKRW